MNCRTPSISTLAPGNESWKIIFDFLLYLKEWGNECEAKRYNFMSDKLCRFLVENCNYKYLMTARLNQDSIERFFSMMRYCYGSNDHPDSRLFIEMYRLVSTFSLIKPPKGSNVTSSEIFNVLLSIRDIDNTNSRIEQWETQIDTILDSGCQSDVLSDAIDSLNEHDYCQSTPLTYAITYVAGYYCKKTIQLPEFSSISENHKLIELRSNGKLLHPSIQLNKLINIIESCIIQVIKNNEDVTTDTLFRITAALETISHAILFTRRIIIFYLITRMHFICKQINKNNSIEKMKTRVYARTCASVRTIEQYGIFLGRPTRRSHAASSRVFAWRSYRKCVLSSVLNPFFFPFLSCLRHSIPRARCSNSDESSRFS
ncbi:hypothetical protein PUN28_019723 [Cardiocondyla obscurior]|uniref:Transposable element P transposase-like RNase H C-terminal domain-containing protein n=1 Tax=Cardiocondyla obscurior TaxID=286306 RepID=A0AAW2EC88_9HYME